jgi:uncharacterized membrane protein
MRRCSILVGLAFVLAVALVMPAVAASGVDYQVIKDKVLVEMSLDRVEDFSYRLPYGYSVLSVNVNYDIEDSDSYEMLEISSGENVEISYVTDALIEKTSDKSFFIVKNQLPFESDVRVFLPEGAVLSERGERLVVPDPDGMETDGRRVILSWNSFNESEIVAAYEFVGGMSVWVFVVIVVLFVIAFVASYLVREKKFMRKLRREIEAARGISKKKKAGQVKKELTRNLFGEEKKIIEYLMDKKGHECWTKEIVRELGISKVRLSRKLRNLEQKELIKRIPYGNENRIRLVKK